MNLFLLVVAALFSVAYAIIGGSKAAEGQFPYQISLREFGLHSCSGIILNEQWVLTDASCVHLRSTAPMTVVTGTNSLLSGGTAYRVARVIEHENFNARSLYNNIALVKINGNITFDDKVQTSSLEIGDVGVGEDVVLSGWGLTSLPGFPSNDLEFLDLKTISTTNCTERLAITGIPVDDTQQMCTYTQRGQGACFGDSGGPLTYQGKVAGIFSWEYLCASGYPDVFTRVNYYIDWINANME